MKELSRIQSLPGGLLVVLLFAVPMSSSSQVVVNRLGSLGGSSVNAFDLNNTGQAAGNGLTAGDLQQHAIRFHSVPTDLGTLGGSSSTAYAINDHGQVVGLSSTSGDSATHAFYFDGALLHDLGTLGGNMSVAVDVNDLGQVTGNSYLTGNVFQHAFRVSGGAMSDLGTLGGDYSAAFALNAQGVVVGESTVLGEVELHAFRSDGTLMVDLGTLGGTYSSAQAINASGWVVGNSTVAFDVEQHAFLHDGNNLIDLGTLGGTYSGAYDVNNAGWVIGDSTTLHDAEYHGFVYGGGVLVDLGSLGGGYSSAWDLNHRGQVVGEASDASGQTRAFLWENGLMVDLNTLLPAGSGWELINAQFINESGDIVGLGFYQGQYDWFYLKLGHANHPPAANAGPDLVVECAGNSTAVVLDGTGSDDPDGDELVYTWTAGGLPLATGPSPTVGLPSGMHQLILTVSDPDGATHQDTVTVTVQDTTPPVISQKSGAKVEVDGDCLATVPDLRGGVVVTDQCSSGAGLTLEQNPAPGVQVGLGTHRVTFTVTDQAGNQSQSSVRLRVVDRQVPVIEDIVSSPAALFPPNNNMMPVELTVSVLDNCDANGVCRIVAIRKNGGSAGRDAVVTGPLTARLRAVSSTKNTATVYTLVVECTDGAGNKTTSHVAVPVGKPDKKPRVVALSKALKKWQALRRYRVHRP